MRRYVLGVVIALVLAAPAQAGGPSLLMGTNDVRFLQSSVVATKANLTIAKLAGFKAVNVGIDWSPGVTTPDEIVSERLSNLDQAARLLGLPVYVAIAPRAGRFAPNEPERRATFVRFVAATARAYPSFTKIIVGNEPNLNRFWAPQFDEDGGNAAARTYLQTLAATYDRLKEISPRITVIGGAVSPRGIDNPNFPTKSHSPTTFIRDLGLNYRASGRTKPVMDWFAFHPYGASSSEPPATRHETSTAISIGDYGKLIRVLGQAFDGTAQKGSKIPIVYDEYGIESTIPPGKARKYTDQEHASTKAIPPPLQGERYKEAIGLAFCAPTVRAMFLFRLFDETNLERWQSGLYYVDRTPKPSLRLVRQAIHEVRRGVVARCPGMRLAVKAKVEFAPPRQAAAAGKRGRAIPFKVSCNLDCRYTAGVIDLKSRKSILAALGQAIGGKKKTVRMPARPLAKGRYRVFVSLVAAVNPGKASRKASLPFVVR